MTKYEIDHENNLIIFNNSDYNEVKINFLVWRSNYDSPEKERGFKDYMDLRLNNIDKFRPDITELLLIAYQDLKNKTNF